MFGRSRFARGDRRAARPVRARASRRDRGGAASGSQLYNRADRAEAEELYGDYVDAVETGTEILADMRDHYARDARRRPTSTSRDVQPGGRAAVAGVRARDREPLMPERIEDYALLSDLQTAALVGRSGSVDWLTFPRFDSSSCFGALLGGREHGRWLIAPDERRAGDERRYRADTLVLESEWQTPKAECG